MFNSCSLTLGRVGAALLLLLTCTLSALAGYVYYDNSKTNWSQVYCYCWQYGTTNEPAKWPGTQMTQKSGNIWQYEVASPYNMVIFNNNSSKSDDLSYTEGHVYVMRDNGKIADSGKTYDEYIANNPVEPDDPDDGVCVYVQGDWSPLYVYIYNESVNPTIENAKWPGKAMTYDASTGLHYYVVPENLRTGSRVIINTNGGSNRYPADKKAGMELNGRSMIFVTNGNQWLDYSSYDPGDVSGNLGTFVSYTDADGVVTIKGTKGSLMITPWAPEIIKVFTLADNAAKRTERRSVSVVDRNDPLLCYQIPEVTYTVDTDDDNISIITKDTSGTDGLEVVVSKETLLVSFRQNGELLLAEAGGLVNRTNSTSITFASNDDPDEAFYGGGYNGHHANIDGITMVMNNNQNWGWNSSYTNSRNINIPYFVSSHGYGVLLDSQYRNARITPSHSGSTYSSGSEDPVAYYFCGGGTLERAMQNYVHLTGHQELPPYWALGYITSKYSFADEDEGNSTITSTKNCNIPIDGVVFDIHWQGGSGSEGAGDMGHLDWGSKYPSGKQLPHNLHNDHGVRTIVITEPFFNNGYSAADNYQMLRSKGWLADESVSNMSWVGNQVGLIDITNPDAAAWFASQYVSHTEAGMGGWWLDLGEPEQHDDGSQFATGNDNQVHNEFSNIWNESVYRALRTSDTQITGGPEVGRKISDVRHMLMPRSGTAGMQRFSCFPWTGDIERSWSGLQAQIPALVNGSMSGIGYLGSDIGGFANTSGYRTDAQLYRRWMQLAVFYPMLRTHSAYKPEVWQEDYDGVRDDVRNAINMRYAYLPYTYTQSYRYTSEGTPIARPAGYADTDPSALKDCSDAYLWGPDIFVAPVLNDGNSRSITFPEGDWIDMTAYDNTNVERNIWKSTEQQHATVNYSAPGNVLPHFQRRGSFVTRFRQDSFTSTDAIESDKITVDYFPQYGGVKHDSFFYDDDHTTLNNHLTGDYLLTTFGGAAYSVNQVGDDNNSMVIVILHEGNGWDSMPASRDILIRVHDLQVQSVNYPDYPFTSEEITMGVYEDEEEDTPEQVRAAEAPETGFVLKNSLDEVRNATEPLTYAQSNDGSELYLRLQGVDTSKNYHINIGRQDVFTGVTTPAVAGSLTFSYGAGMLTYSASEGLSDVRADIWSADGSHMAGYESLQADGYARQIAPGVAPGVYIARLTARTADGQLLSKTVKMVVR